MAIAICSERLGNMQKGIWSILALGGVLTVSSVHAEEPVFGGIQCERISGPSTGVDAEGSIFNGSTSASTLNVVCPIVRNDRNGDPAYLVDPEIIVDDAHNTEAISCT
ncbi:MAG TPA: hypothetical protein VHO25_20235, partial [Polyangiaceae bacterium]|nr:hypothetical protein [Polyangiaceae bacterium]